MHVNDYRENGEKGDKQWEEGKKDETYENRCSSRLCYTGSSRNQGLYIQKDCRIH